MDYKERVKAVRWLVAHLTRLEAEALEADFALDANPIATARDLLRFRTRADLIRHVIFRLNSSSYVSDGVV